MSKSIALLFVCCLTAGMLTGQDRKTDIPGYYTDGMGPFAMTELELKNDGTFKLTTIDPVFPYQHEKKSNEGQWVLRDKAVILNPQKAPRRMASTLETGVHTNQDSVTIRIDYLLNTFEDEVLVSSAPFAFDQLTVFINKKRNYHHLVRHEKRQTCAFAPRIKNQLVVDAENQVRLPKEEITRIGIMTYGFDSIKWFEVNEKNANNFVFSIVHPVDTERTPRSQEVIVKGKRAYFYQYQGRVNTSIFANPLLKRK